MLALDLNRLLEKLAYDPKEPLLFNSGFFIWFFAAFINPDVGFREAKQQLFSRIATGYVREFMPATAALSQRELNGFPDLLSQTIFWCVFPWCREARG